MLNPSVAINITYKTIEKKGVSKKAQYYSNSGTYCVSCMLILMQLLNID